MARVIDNKAESRFELPTGAGPAYSEYMLEEGVLIVRHTEVPRELEGQGIGSDLARGILEEARARGLKVEARCPFVRAYMKRHPEFDDLKA